MQFAELFENCEKVYFSIMTDDKDKFISMLEDESFHWLDGSPVKKGDGCNGHMAVHSDKHIANVAWFCWFHPQAADIPKYDFAEFLKGNLVTSGDRLVSYTVNGRTTLTSEEE